MSRVTGGKSAHARHRKVVKKAKGYKGRRNNCFRMSIQAVERAQQFAYRDRRTKKRNFRALWIQRINAGAREHGLTYSQLMNGLKKSGIELDRKVLADLAVNGKDAFADLVKQAQDALKKAA